MFINMVQICSLIQNSHHSLKKKVNLNCLPKSSFDFLVNIKFNWTNLLLLLETCQERWKTSAKGRKILWYPVLHTLKEERAWLDVNFLLFLLAHPEWTASPNRKCAQGAQTRKIFGVCYVSARLVKGFWCQVEPEDRVEFQRQLLLYLKVLHLQEYESLYITRQENIRINYQFPFLYVRK